jgi:hypothetical protein
LRTRRSYIDGDVLDEIRDLAERGWTAGQIHKDLSKNESFSGRVPTDRTIRRLVAKTRIRDASKPWSIADADPATARAVLDVLAFVVWEHGGRIPPARGGRGADRKALPSLSQDEAEWVGRIWRVAPDLRPVDLLDLARSYRWFAQEEQGTEPLDCFLAIAPWRSETARTEWESADNAELRHYTAPRRVLERWDDAARYRQQEAVERPP